MLHYQEIPSFWAPVLSSDGKLLACLSDENGHAEVLLHDLETGRHRLALRLDEPAGRLAFAPGGRDLLLTADRGGDERHQFLLLLEGAEEPVALTADPGVVHAWGAWSPDARQIAFASNARDPAHMDIYLLDLATGARRMLHRGHGWREPVAFAPDGGRLIVREAISGPTDQQLAILDLATGSRTPILPHEGRAQYPAVRMLSDGTGFYVITDQGRQFAGLGLHRYGTDALEWIAAPENCDIETMALDAGRGRIAYTVNREGWSHVFLHDIAVGQSREIPLPRLGRVASLAFAADGALILPLDGATTPPGIWRIDPASGEAAALHAAAPALPASREPTAIRVTSDDGLQVPVFVYRPDRPPPAGGYPSLVIVHGGPEAQWTPTFRADIQWMLARGIMVFAPNVRGSTGYGRDYQHLDDVERRPAAVRDLEAVGRWVAARGDCDPACIGVFGRSYGGFMALAAVTESPEIWRYAIDFYGIANFETLLETTGPWRRALREAEYGSIERDAVLLRRLSPIRRADAVRVPVLFVHGLEDPRVAPSESEMMFAALRGRGKSCEILRIPGEGHGFARRASRQRVFGAVAAFIERHLPSR